MRKLLVVSAILQFAITAAAAKWQTAASKAEVLSLEQEIRISQLIAAQTALDQLTRKVEIIFPRWGGAVSEIVRAMLTIVARRLA